MNNWSDLILILRVIADILVVWALIYAGLRIIRNNNRTIQIVKGILALFFFKTMAMWLHLKTVSWLLDFFLDWGVLFILVILQPEIRSMLEKVGKTNTAYSANIPSERVSKMIDELVTAVEDMSKSKTGALITLQMGQSLEDFAKTGIPMDSDVTSELLETIFQYGTPMHDGAVIIEGDKLAAAAAYYPSTAKDLPSRYGARHRAAVGISEVTDSITLVVSEETGTISIAQKGVLTPYNPEALKRFLTNVLISEESPAASAFFAPMFNTARSISSGLKSSKQEKKSRPKDDRIMPLEVVDKLKGEDADAK